MRVDNTNKIYKRKWHGTKNTTGGCFIGGGGGWSFEKCEVVCVDYGVRGEWAESQSAADGWDRVGLNVHETRQIGRTMR